MDFEFKFICGNPDSYSEADMNQLQRENKDDFVFLSVQDFYKNMPSKVLKFYQWAVESEKKYDYVLKIDDDSFVNIEELSKALNVLPTSRYSYFFENTKKIG